MDRLKLAEAGLRAFDERLPEVTSSMCVVTRYRSSSCRLCLDVCPGGDRPRRVAEGRRRVLHLVRRLRGGLPDGCARFDARADAVRERFNGAGLHGRQRVTLACRVADCNAGEATHDTAGVVADDLAVAVANDIAVAVEDDTATIVMTCLGGLSSADLIGAAAAGLAGVTLRER